MSVTTEPHRLRSLFINSLHYETTEASLKSHFEKFGEVVYCSVKKDRITGRSRCFGFITYKRSHMVDDAQAARPHEIDGRVIKSKRVFPEEQSSKPGVLSTVNALYISGITKDINEEDLRKYFGSYGKIVGVNIVTDKDGKRKGYAFVEFDDYDPVDKIVLYRHECKGRKLDVSKALSREIKEYMQFQKETQGTGRGMSDRTLWRQSDGYRVGGSTTGYGCGYGGGNWQSFNNFIPWGRGWAWNVGYVNNFPRGCVAWRGNFRGSYGRIPVQVNTGNVKRMQGHNDGGQGCSGENRPR